MIIVNQLEINQMKTKNIIFDLGGVVINLKRERAVEALEKLGVDDVDELLGVYSQSGPFLQLETGELSSAEFYDLLLPKCQPGTTCRDLRDAFEKFLIDIPEERLRLIERLKGKGYRLFVLSNTNPIMYHHWIEREFRRQGKSINDYFEGIVTSFQEGTCKPDPRIFRNLVERYELCPSETLMLDDSEKNTSAAESIGLQAVRIEPEGEFSFDSVCGKLLAD